MDHKETELTEDELNQLNQVTGGSGNTGTSEPAAENPFRNLPRVDTNPYSQEVRERI